MQHDIFILGKVYLNTPFPGTGKSSVAAAEKQITFVQNSTHKWADAILQQLPVQEQLKSIPLGQVLPHQRQTS